MKLSEQQLVSCDPNCGGCYGGLEWLAFEYVMQNPLSSETDYPYTAKNDACTYDRTKGKVNVTDYFHLPPNSADQLRAALDMQPTCVSVNAGDPIFYTY